MQTHLLVLCTFFLLFSCSNNADIPTETKATDTKATSAEEPYGTLQIDEFLSMMEAENTLLLDVRTPKEWADGIIPGADTINVLDASYTAKIQGLDQSKTVLVYCRSGNRSKRASEILVENGFTNVHHLGGGYLAYREATE